MEATLGLRQAHTSQHLMLLRDAGLVTDQRDGWNICYHVCQPEIFQVIDALGAFSSAPTSAQSGKNSKAAHKPRR